MAYTSEIDKLEARYQQNPKGRNFAPLADAYRKAGLIDNAVELCQNGLKLHPDYVSAYIVYARCLVDKKDDPGAHDVFKQVLDLDRENIIALRGLAELAERTGKFDEAVEWLGRLLNVDPMNGDAAEALARAKGKLASGAPAPSSPGAATAPMTKPDFAVEHEEPTAVEIAQAPPRPSGSTPMIENFENPISFNPNAHAAAKAEGLEVQEDVELNPQQIEQVDIEGLARTQYEGSGMFKLDAPEPAMPAAGAAPDLDEALPQVDLPLIMPDEESVSRVAAHSAPVPPPPPVPPPAPSPPPAPRDRVPAAVALSDDDGAADTATLSQAEPVVTETMAELYLKQGHQQDALRVYQALLAQRPNDAKLRAKVQQLSHGGKKGSGVSAQAFLKGIWSGKGAPKPPEPQSTLAAAFDVAGPLPGEPSHPAQDHISLDSVFGEEVARRSSTPAPAESATGAPEAGAAPTGASATGGGGGGFSFDDFFAGGKGEAQASPDGGASAKTPGGSARVSGRTQRPPEDEAETDQFQQWLKKLKS
ncbi:MAG TPA: tetratricopeptide repeat protein [Gemmatimonadales bacterium]